MAAADDDIITVEYCLMCNRSYVKEELKQPHSCKPTTNRMVLEDMDWWTEADPADNKDLHPICTEAFRSLETSPFTTLVDMREIYPEVFADDDDEDEEEELPPPPSSKQPDGSKYRRQKSHLFSKTPKISVPLSTPSGPSNGIGVPNSACALKFGMGFFVPDQPSGHLVEANLEEKLVYQSADKNRFTEYDLGFQHQDVEASLSSPLDPDWRQSNDNIDNQLETMFRCVSSQLEDVRKDLKAIRATPGYRAERNAWLECWDYQGRLCPDGVTHTGRLTEDQYQGVNRYWSNLTNESRFNFMRGKVRFSIRGLNHVRSFMLYPLIEYVFLKRAPCWRQCSGCDGNVLRAETVYLYPDQLIARVSQLRSAEFMRYSNVVRLDMRGMRMWLHALYCGNAKSLNKPSSAVFQELCARVMMSWTFYRGMVMQMFGTALHYHVANKEAISLAAMTLLQNMEQDMIDAQQQQQQQQQQLVKKRKNCQAKKKKKKQPALTPPPPAAAEAPAPAEDTSPAVPDDASSSSSSSSSHSVPSGPEEQQEQQEQQPLPAIDEATAERFKQMTLFADFARNVNQCPYCPLTRAARDYDCVPMPCGHVQSCLECLGPVCRVCQQPITHSVPMQLP
jgi:hypothetical protein